MKRLTAFTLTAALTALTGCVSFDDNSFSKELHEAVDEAVIPMITNAVEDTKLLITACGEFYVSRATWPTSKAELEAFLSDIGSTASLAEFKDMIFKTTEEDLLKLSYKKKTLETDISYTLQLRGGDIELIKKALEEGNKWPTELIKDEAYQGAAHNGDKRRVSA